MSMPDVNNKNFVFTTMGLFLTMEDWLLERDKIYLMMGS